MGDQVRFLSSRAGFVKSLSFAIGGFLLVGVLAALPYSTSFISSGSAREAAAPPGASFSLGPLVWPARSLSTEARLEPFRAEFAKRCGSLKGLAASACFSSVLARTIPMGNPPDEFVSASFDPNDHLRRHLAGAPGHCLTRSAILATALLATGTPARVVQLIPPGAKGHTVVEAFDGTWGWVLVDPLYGGAFGDSLGPASGLSLQSRPREARWHGFGQESGALEAGSGPSREELEGFFRGSLVYPDPWLYLRLGESAAPWPYRGRFVQVGPGGYLLGPAQSALVIGALFCFVASAGCLARTLVRRGEREATQGKRPALGTLPRSLPISDGAER